MASDSNLEPWLSAALIPPFAPWWSTASGSMPLLWVMYSIDLRHEIKVSANAGTHRSVNPPFTSNWTQEAAQTTSQTSFAASGLRPPRSATSADLIASQTGIPPALNPSASQSESPFHRTQHPYGPHQAENEDDDDDDIFVSARTTSGSKRKTSMSESGRRKKRVVAEESEAQM